MKVLITTALEPTQTDMGDTVYLGEWCRVTEDSDDWSKPNYSVIPHHWDDRTKLRHDYIYLKELHLSLLQSLTKALNTFHKINRPLRYWRIILDPWLLTYVAVVFDRWECLRKAFKENNALNIIKIEKTPQKTAPLNCANFHNLVQDEYWNYNLFSEIINKEYLRQCGIKKISISLKKEKSKIQHSRQNKVFSTRIKNILRKIAKITDNVLGKVATRNPVVFYKSYFPLLPFLRLNLSLFQLPRFYKAEFQELGSEERPYIPHYSQNERAKIVLNQKSKSHFECFLLSRIIKDIPIVYLEGFQISRAQVDLIPEKPKLILTANGYWINDLFKLWAAENVFNGCKLALIQHGGSLTQGSMFAFDFEENISDNFITWSQPCHSKHVRLSPTKLIGFRPKKSSKKYCSLIGCEWPRYAFRIQASPISGQTLRHYRQAIRFYHFLKPEIKEKFRVKPYENQGWNLRQRFIDDIGMNKVYEKQCFNHVLSMSRVVVVTYPETAFSESMLSGLPTILLYPCNLWELHPFMQPLLTTLKKSKIAFHNSKAAAFHLNSIWNHADLWWRSPDVLVAREKFKRIAVDTKKDWLKQWKDFISEKTDKTLV